MSVPPQREPLIETFAALLKGHDEVVNRCRRVTAETARHDRSELAALFKGFHEARSEWEAKQVTLADDFNLFQVMGVADDEVTHSKILAWLLDRRVEQGSHAQGKLGFRLFIEELGTELGSESTPTIRSYPDEPYWVRCEVSGSQSRIDIEIASRGKFIIHIENKIWSSEGPDQTHREWCDLERRAKELGIPTANVHGIFLTLDGSQPENEHFVAVRWHRIVSVLDRFAEKAQAIEVKWFVAHYAKALSKLALTEPETEEGEDGDSTL
jgi:hypothetical protein